MRNCNDEDEQDDPLDGFATARDIDEALQDIRKMVHGRGSSRALMALTKAQTVIRLAVEGANSPTYDSYDKLEAFLR